MPDSRHPWRAHRLRIDVGVHGIPEIIPINMKHAGLSRLYLKTYFSSMRKTWPIWNGSFFILIALAGLFAIVERIQFTDSLYFTFVTALTIGYGDIVPHQPLGRLIAIIIGFLGAITMGFFIALAIHSANHCLDDDLKLK